MSLKEIHPNLTSEERRQLAQKFREIRHADRHPNIRDGIGYQTTRDYEGYLRSLLTPINNLMDYLSSIKENPTLLDLGAGQGFATAEIAHIGRDKGIKVIGTSLTWSLNLSMNLGSENIHITSAEELRGVGNVDGIIAVHSLSYAVPDLAVRSIDQALSPGGVVVANFSTPESEELHRERIKAFPDQDHYTDTNPVEEYDLTYVPFQKAFNDLGYATDFRSYDTATLVAIKPGGKIEDPIGLFFHKPHTV